LGRFRAGLVSGFWVLVLFVSVFGVVLNVPVVWGSGTIYIKADGSIDPPTANITTSDYVTYTFIGNISDSIVVQRSNIIVDGSGYTLEGTGSGNGFDLSGNNITIRNTTITGFYMAIYSLSTLNNIITNNSIISNTWGIDLEWVTGYVIGGNEIGSQSQSGIYLRESRNNIVINNSISSNKNGITLVSYSNYNKIYHNNFVNNTSQGFAVGSANNIWDDGYPSGGNYWSDYTGVDLYTGPYQNETGSDGIGDTPYTIWPDRYPLTSPWGFPQRPAAYFVYFPERSIVNETVSLNASTSQDRDGSIVSYEWNFGDGNVTTTADSIITHSYVEQGTFAVNLIVTDDDGLSSSILRSMRIKIHRSSITINAEPSTAVGGSNITLSGTIMPLTVDEDVTISYRLPSETWSVLAVARTDSNGNYSCLWKTTSAGIYEVKAGWQGDENTWSAESEAKSVSLLASLYIRPDGSIDPPAPIRRDGDFYTVTGNIYGGIAVQRNNIVIDGNGYTLKGPWPEIGVWNDPGPMGYGFYLSGANNVTIKRTNIKGFWHGVYLVNSSYNTIFGNNIGNSRMEGVILSASSNNNTVFGNNISNNVDSGVYLNYSSYNTISGNNITNNRYGINLYDASNNSIAGNNITANNQPGIWVVDSSNNIISGNNITANNHYGISLSRSFNNVISGNNITANMWYDNPHYTASGIFLLGSSNNTISGNNITANGGSGITLGGGTNNTISGNNITNNWYGIYLYGSPTNNAIYHNNFVNYYPLQASIEGSVANVWDDGYPSGGNYWGDYWNWGGVYIGVDLFVGPFQNETGSDGIGDNPYIIIDANNQDHYPLMNPWIPGSPIAYFTHTPRFPLVTETVTFNASDSYDYDGDIISYEWNFGDGNTTIVAEPIIVHVYTAQGVYSVNLTVTDNEGFRRSITRSIAVGTDTTPPITLDDYDALWHTSDFTITLTATDDLSGVAETYYRINDGPIQNLSAHGHPLITTEGADNKLEYWSVDNADNEELPHKILTGIKLDKTYPTIETPSRTPDGDVFPDQSVKVSVNVTDALSQVKNVTLSYTINNGDTWTDLPMNHTVSNLYEAIIPPQEAGTTVRFKIVAYDHAGNNATLGGTEPYYIYQVIPEFPSTTLLTLFIIATLFATILLRRKRHSKSQPLFC